MDFRTLQCPHVHERHRRRCHSTLLCALRPDRIDGRDWHDFSLRADARVWHLESSRVGGNLMLKRLLAATLLICLFVGLAAIIPFPTKAVQPIYGGIYSSKYVTRSEVLFTEITNPLPASPSVTLTTTYSMICV